MNRNITIGMVEIRSLFLPNLPRRRDIYMVLRHEGEDAIAVRRFTKILGFGWMPLYEEKEERFKLYSQCHPVNVDCVVKFL